MKNNHRTTDDSDSLIVRLHETIYFRYFIYITTIVTCLFFHESVPLNVPMLTVVSCIALGITIVLHLLSRHPHSTSPAISSAAIFDAGITPFILYCTGGFASPLIPVLLVLLTMTTLLSCSTRRAQFLPVFFIAGYLAVALLQKSGILLNNTPFAAQLQADTALFFYIVVLVSASTIALWMSLCRHVRRNLDRLAVLDSHLDLLEKAATLPADAVFFERAAAFFSDTLSTRGAAIVRILPDNRIGTLGVWIDDKLLPSQTLPAEKTLAALVFGMTDQKPILIETPSELGNDPILKYFKPAAVAGFILHDVKNEPIGAVYAVHDAPFTIPDHLSMAIATVVRRTAGELQHLVNEENDAVIDRNRFQHLKMQTAGKMASVIAHDFNNIISAISGYASLLKKKHSSDERTMLFLDHISEAGKHASDITAQLSRLVKNEKPRNEPIDIAPLVRSVIEQMQKTHNDEFSFSYQASTEDTLFSGDGTQLLDILIRLASNACDACIPGNGEISFSIAVSELEQDSGLCRSFSIGGGKYLQIELRDNGCGMDETQLDRIFDPYFSTKPKEIGRGLSLSFVWQFVETFHGALEFSSHPGKGTIARLYLPMTSQKTTPSPTRHPEVKTSPKPDSQLPPTGIILIVDDEPSVREIYSEILTDSGFPVHTCIDGKDAVEFIEKNPDNVNLILLDLVMPRMTGPEAFFAIRALKPDLKILLMSGTATNPQLPEMLKIPGTRFFQKPCDDDSLLENVRNML